MLDRDGRGKERHDPERRDTPRDTPRAPPETSPTPGVEESSPASAASPAAAAGRGSSGPVAELGLVAAGLGLVIYLIGFVTNLGGSSSLILPLLLGGGLLAGSVALPTVGGRVLAPAAVATTTGALLLLRAVDRRRRECPLGRRAGAGPARGRGDGRCRADALRGGARAPAEGAEGRPDVGVLRLPRRPAVPGAAVPGPAPPGRVPRRRPAVPGRPVGGRARLRPERPLRRSVRGARLPAAPARRSARLRPAARPVRGADRGRRRRGAR